MLLRWSVLEPPGYRFVDLAVYQQAGRSLLSGGDLYGFVTPHGLAFTYPPFAALLAVPLAHLPVRLAGTLWALGTLVALWALVRRTSGPLRAALVERLGPVRGGLAGGLLLAAALWTQPLRDTVRFGQVGVLLALAVVVGCTSRRPWAPALVGLAAAVKLTPVLAIAWLLLTGRRRDAAVAAGGAVACTLLGALVLPRASWTYWTSAVFDTSRVGALDNGGNQSVRGMLVRAGLSSTALWVGLVVVLLVVGLPRAARLGRRDQVAGLAALGCLTVAVTPIAWIHHLVWLVPALAVLAGDLRSRRRVVAASVVLVGLWARLPWEAADAVRSGLPGHPLWLLVGSSQGLAVVALALLLPRARHAPAHRREVVPVTRVRS